jgi:hypothetical protein
LLNNIARNELWRKAEGQAREDNAETEATRHHKKQRDKQERTMQRQRPQDTTKNRGTSKRGQYRDRGHKTPQKAKNNS